MNVVHLCSSVPPPYCATSPASQGLAQSLRRWPSSRSPYKGMINLDLGAEGRVVGIVILAASNRLSRSPSGVRYGTRLPPMSGGRQGLREAAVARLSSVSPFTGAVVASTPDSDAQPAGAHGASGGSETAAYALGGD